MRLPLSATPILSLEEALGPYSEIAVAAALWDIHDSPNTNEPWDVLSGGIGPTWDVFANGSPKAETIGAFQKNWTARQAATARKVAVNLCAHQAGISCIAISFAKN